MTRLVGRYERPLYGFLLRLCGDRQAAEDLFQETFLRLHRSRGSFDGRRPLKPYLYRIALNAARDWKGREARRQTLPLRSGAPLPDPAPSPHEAAVAFERRRDVHASVAALPEHERLVVWLRVFQGLTFPEVAAAMETPVATAKSRMLYALRRLRPVLEARFRPGDEEATA